MYKIFFIDNNEQRGETMPKNGFKTLLAVLGLWRQGCQHLYIMRTDAREVYYDDMKFH